MAQKLTLQGLINSAKEFCKQESEVEHTKLFGVTDGKALGTFVEQRFQKYLNKNFDMTTGNSANGLDLPSINTDIKVTSINQPQSSCPFSDSKQKIYGLGYHLIVFVYQKTDNLKARTGKLKFVSCTFIDKSRTADYQTTTGIRNIVKNNGNEDDLYAFLCDHKIPSDEVTLMNMAKELLKNPPEVGYLTISNALQWRLQYGRVVNLDESVSGINPIVKYTGGNG